MKKVVTLIILLATTIIVAQSEKFKKVDSIIASKIKEDGPGIMVGIVKDGNIIYEKYRGLANMEHQVKISSKTRSNIASTAKQFTALMVLQLSLKEKLSLEDDIRKYIPSLYPNVNESIKVRHLINHTSGIRDYVELMSLQNRIWWKQAGLDNSDILELLEKQEDLGFKPGTDYSYSNSNYNVLAKIIEKVSGEKFTTYSTKFFKGLGMNSSEFIRRYMQVIPNRAAPYSDWGYGELFHNSSITKTAGEGFLYTTLKDQLYFEQAIQNANHNNNILLIKSQKPIPNSEINTYGFGLKLDDRLGRIAVHHDGVTHAYNCQTLRFPNEKLTVFIMSNNGNIRSDKIADAIAKIFLSPLPKNTKYDQLFYDTVDSKETIKILGQYNYPDNKTIVQIIEKEGKKYWKEPNFTLELVPLKQNSFSFAYNPKLKVIFYNDEMVEYYESGKTKAYKRNTTSQPSYSDLAATTGKYYNNELELGFEIKFNKGNKLQLKFSNDKRFQNITVYNRVNLLANGGVYLDLQRDQFNRVTKILVNYGRAKNMTFKKKTNLKFQPKIPTKNGSINVTTIGSRNSETSKILLTKNYANGNEIWYKKFGGSGYDKASSILDTEDGYLIIGSTSSYGKGNYDMYVIKTDKEGNKIWQNTYGQFNNDYGYTAEKVESGFIIKGTIQLCNSKDVLTRKCSTNVWFVTIDENGKELSNEILEEI